MSSLPETFSSAGTFHLDAAAEIVFAQPPVGETITLVLPPSIQALGQPTKCIKNLGPGALVIEAPTGETIDGVASLDLGTTFMVSMSSPLPDGSGWAIIAGVGLP